MNFNQLGLRTGPLILLVLVLSFCLYNKTLLRATVESIVDNIHAASESQPASVGVSDDDTVVELTINWLAKLVSEPTKAMLAIFSGKNNEVIFTSLPNDLERTPLSPSSFIKLIVINTNPGDRVKCSRSVYPYEFFVLFADNTNTLESACGMGGDKYNYAFEISEYLSYSRGLPRFTKEDLERVSIIIGDGQEVLNKLNGNTD